MTGYAAEVDSARSEGFDVLPKSCGPETIADALSRVLAHRCDPMPD
jgi:hypothetical protein